MTRMKNDKGQPCMPFENSFYGSSTLGERGQLVIPAEARMEMGFHPGDKILIFKHPVHKGLMLVKIEGLRAFLDEFSATISRLEEVRMKETGTEE